MQNKSSERDATEEAGTSLPVVESVAAYEKLHRIGEGTYGVVCESVKRLSRKGEGWKGMVEG